jgi:multicomponent Na+:H+ antiporter subunit D
VSEDFVRAVVVLLVVAPLLAAALVAGVGRWVPRSAADVFAAAVAVGSLAGSSYLLFAHSSDRVVVWVGGYSPEGRTSVGIGLVADRAADTLVVVAAALVSAAVIYSWSYVEDVHAGEHALMLVFLAGMTGFAFAADLFNAFVWFELMSVAAFAMTGLRVEEPRSVHGALTFGAMTAWAATVSLLGISLVYALSGELNLALIGNALHQQGPSRTVDVACALVMTGYLVKAAAVPWHFWTADAEAVAPAPVCALLSGSMVALGVYGMARAWWTMFAPVVSEDAMRVTLLALGCLTAVIGALMCTTQRHIKRLLAYSTISHVGVMLIAVGLLGEEGLAAAGLYAVGHACVKGSLFLGTGVLLNRFESVDEHSLYGRGVDMPLTRLAFLLGAIALVGFPACGVWLGKSALEHATTAETQTWLTAAIFVVLLTVSVCTGGSVLRMTARVFWGAGPPPRDAGEAEEEEPETGSVLSRAPLRMVGPAWALLLVGLTLGLIPGLPTAAERGAAAFTDVTGFSEALLSPGHAQPPPMPTAPSPWTAQSVGFGVLATLLAAGLAAAWLWGAALAERWQRPRAVLARPVRTLHRMHSGHLGDYVAWAMLGAAVVGLAIAST